MLLLEIEESDKQIVSGIPEKITITTNLPSNIYYTMDGTTPTEDSSLYDGPVYLYLDRVSVTLQIFAKSETEESPVSSFTWQVEGDVSKSLIYKYQRKAILYADDDPSNVKYFRYDEDGEQVAMTSLDVQDLDLIASKSNSIGEDIPNGSSLSFVNFPIKPRTIQQVNMSNPNEVYFDPKAKLVIIDNYEDNSTSEQSVRIILRPNGTFSSSSTNPMTIGSSQHLTTGNLVNWHMNPRTGKIVFYYYESIDNKWIQSIQKVTPKKFNFTPTSGANPFVFKWIENRAQSKIF